MTFCVQVDPCIAHWFLHSLFTVEPSITAWIEGADVCFELQGDGAAVVTKCQEFLLTRLEEFIQK